MKKGEKDVEILRGDGLVLSMETNNKLLKIMGDGCKITLSKNFGTIRVNGDGCQLKVVQNLGLIEYKGDGGRVYLGPDSYNKVTFSGCGGHLKFLDEKRKSGGKSGNITADSKAKDDLPTNFSGNQKQKKFCEFKSENRENERRERRKVDQKYERGPTVIGTKIVGSNGEYKTNVRTFFKNVSPTRS
ncbi:uncharacterized protein LOC117178930 [Belonocnema kinseyi]|uniref:uncharacterized protein LOC117178930 n=1 Tax=Belonocnema kinseyi TaxID=2817044 RepID=UPI00143D9D95|nr:uncharacterized protein LOC117178930 [Belonocnema kinseyi]